MIRPRDHLASVRRDEQRWGDRRSVVRLEFNELVPHLDAEVFARIIERLDPAVFSAYPSVEPFYTALSRYYCMTEDHFVATSASDAAIRQTFDTFCDPGDAIVITYPTYGMYPVYAQLCAVECVRVQYRADFSVDVSELLESLSPRTKLVAIANPNGALGSVIDPASIERVVRRASEVGAVVLLDEAHIHFYVDHWTRRVDEFDNLLLCRTFSKAAGLAGLRLGYLLANPVLAEWIRRCKPVVESNSVALTAGTYLLEHPEVLERAVQTVVAGRELLACRLREYGFEVIVGNTNFVHVAFGHARRAICNALAARNIRVKDAQGDGILARFTRITAGGESTMRQVIDVVSETMVDLSGGGYSDE